MRYNSSADGQRLRRSALGPAAALSRRQYALPIPGRGVKGLQAGGSKTSLRGFGAAGLAPIGAGAGAGAAIGASQGASIGSAIVPGIGTAIGAVIGAIGGAIAGAINKKDPENVDFNAAVATWQQNPNNVYSIGNPYLALAGLFDLNIQTNIPIYKKFGHMGEAAFVVWLCNTVYQAAQTGQIGPSDTALSVMSKVVQPQIDSWGYGPMSDPHADLITRLIQTMILQYCAGAQTNWYAIGGDYPTQFRSLPAFAFPQAGPPLVTAGPTPSPVATPAPVPTTSYTTPAAASASPDGTYITTPGGALVSNTGVTFGILGTTDGVGNYNLSVGGQQNGSGRVILKSAGAVYAASTSGWYLWNPNVGWAQISEPAQAIALGMPATMPPISGTTSTTTTPTATQTVSTTPPVLGASISYVRDNTTGQMIALPASGVYAGLTSTGGWLVTYPSGGNEPAGTYEANNGALMLYGSTATNSAGVPAGYAQTAQSVLLNGTQYPLYSDQLGNLYVWTGGNMIPYTSAANTAAAGATTTSSGGGGGGGGGYYSSPTPDTSGAQSSAVLPLATPGGLDPGTLLVLGGAAVGLYLLMGAS